MNLILTTESLLAVIIFAVPIFFTTLTLDFYETNKLTFLAFTIPLALVLWLVSALKDNKIKFLKNPLNLAVLNLGIIALASTLITSPNKMESLISPSGSGIILLLVILFFILTNNLRKREFIVYPLLLGASVLAILYIFQFFGMISVISPLEFMKNDVWTPTGGLLYTAIIIACCLPLALDEIFKRTSESQSLKKSLLWIGVLTMSLGLALSAVKLTTTAKPVLLPFSAGWSVAIDTMRNVKTAFFGVGPGQFLTIFTQSKPLALNTTNVWNLNFTRSTSFILNTLTEIGLLGLVVYVLIFWRVFQKNLKRLNQGVILSLLIMFAAQIIFPATVPILLVTIVLLAIYAKDHSEKEVVEESRLLLQVLLVIGILITGVTYFYAWKFYQAEKYLLTSAVARSNNQGLETYNAQLKAVQAAPVIDRYHVFFSQTNIDLANAIVQQSGDNLSDQNRQDIVNLIQQAIEEAKLAVNLNPRKSANWENLASIYRNLINATDGADQWAITSYRQAVTLDPLNPALRVSLGGLFFQLKNTDEAIAQFQTAVNLKYDYANAHYNLANAYKEKADFENAFKEMQNTLALVDPQSNDFTKASAELEELRAKLPQKQEDALENQAETLTQPEETKLNIDPKLDLPEEAAPDVGPETEMEKKEELPVTTSPTNEPPTPTVGDQSPSPTI